MSPESESGVKLGRRFDAGSVLHRYSPIPPPSASDCFTRAAQESETSKTTPTLSEFIASHFRNKSTWMLSTLRISVPNIGKIDFGTYKSKQTAEYTNFAI